MAFTSGLVLEVESGASDSNAGGFDTGVAGFPTDGAATLATSSAPVFSSASYNFVAGDVGAWIYIKSGTNWTPGWYKVVSVAANAATLSAAAGAGVLAAGTPTTAVGCATTASPTAATWGIDYSQQTGAQIAFTDMVIGATTTQFTSAANPIGKNFVGNVINVVSGTNFVVQRVAVVSTSGTTATCDKSLGTAAASGGHGNLGGAVASPALPFSIVVSGNAVWVKTASYSITSASTNVAGGCISTAITSLLVEGYGTVRGDLGTPPTLIASAISTFVLAALTAVSSRIVNFILNGASLTSSTGLNLSGGAYLVQVKNCTNNGIMGSPTLLQCTATGCSSQTAMIFRIAVLCMAYANTVTGMAGSTALAAASLCLSINNTGASSDGFLGNSSENTFVNCAAYGNGRDGFRFVAGSQAINCIAESNSGVGINDNAVANVLVSNAVSYNNGTNVSLTGANHIAINLITPTADVFVNAAGGNFALNANAGGGALLRAAGIPGVTPDGLSQGYADIGAIQSHNGIFFPPGMNGGMAA